MRILLKFPRPSSHWVGLSNLITQSDGLRGDVTLVVDADGVRFFEKIDDESPIPVMTRRHPRFDVETLSGKLSFLQWLHDTFPKEEPVVANRAVRIRPLPNFYRGGAIARTVRFGATASTR
jgi:hypothetical protein